MHLIFNVLISKSLINFKNIKIQKTLKKIKKQKYLGKRLKVQNTKK